MLPWAIRRMVLCKFFGYQLHRDSWIGLAWVFPKELFLGENAHIGHLTIVKGLNTLRLEENASIGRLNWITGFPQEMSTSFQHKPGRKAVLTLRRHAKITHRHLIDSTDSVTIGEFSLMAGYHSKILTHTIDLENNRQSCAPVSIGKCCFIGTNCIVLAGSSLPDCSVLGAGAVLQKGYTDSHRLYAGVPARPVRELPADWQYFNRTEGFVS